MKLVHAAILSTMLLVVGCTRSRSMDDFRAQLEHQQDKIADIERSLVNARQEQLKQRTAAPLSTGTEDAARNRELAQLSGSIETLRVRLAELDERLAALEKGPAPAAAVEPEPPPGKILPSKSIPVSIYNAPDNRAADFIETPQGDSVDFFPVRITGATGRKTVVATHMTTKIVESPKGARDEYGRKVPERREIQEPVNEYAYEVVFSAQNLTRTEKNLSYTAGAATRSLVLKPGESVADITVRSAFGADLHAEVGGMVRNFPISY